MLGETVQPQRGGSHTFRSPALGWRGSFYRLAVHPKRRRQGIATTLLREGEQRLRARGATRLTAIVADDEPGAMALWTAAGYTQQQNRARFVRH